MLLADFHVHTSWSDGRLSLPEVVDLFGRSGHQIIAITDHVADRESFFGRFAHHAGLTLTSESFPRYREAIEKEAARAWREYRMLVLPGVELTRNSFSRDRSMHALAIGIDEFVSADGPVEEMLTRSRDAGAVTVRSRPRRAAFRRRFLRAQPARRSGTGTSCSSC